MRSIVALGLVLVAVSSAARANDLDRMRDRVAARVEELRGLEFRAPVPLHAPGDSILKAQLWAQVRRFSPLESLRNETAACIQLGLWPAYQDLSTVLESVLDEQVAGYYDTELDAFFVAERFSTEMLPIIMAHELTHALDDQYFAIDTMVKRVLADNDRVTALAGVVEGSGMLIMSRYLMDEIRGGRFSPEVIAEFQASELQRSERLFAAPPLLQRDLLGPYILGLVFMLRGEPARLLTGSEPGSIDSVFVDPPQSSEQLLHPEKYWDETQRDAPVTLPDPDLAHTLGKNWRKRAQGTLGELRLAQLVGATTPALDDSRLQDPAAWTHPAAAGWGGDRWQLYSNGKANVTVLATLWDTEADAAEFAAAIKALPTPTPPPPQKREPFIWGVDVEGSAVVLVAGFPGKNATALVRAALAAIVP